MEGSRRLASLALAATMSFGIPTVAHAANNEPITIEDTQTTEKEYVVKDGDTLGKIAKTYLGNSGYWELLAEYNHLKDPNKLTIGQIIKIPADLLTSQVCNTNNSQYEGDKTYTVKKGDTLYCIVRVQYGLKNQETVDKLATYNNLGDPNRLSVGQVLLIPTIEKLQNVIANDYSAEYNRMGSILNNKEQSCIIIPCDPSPCHPEPCEPGLPYPGAPCPGPVRVLKP